MARFIQFLLLGLGMPMAACARVKPRRVSQYAEEADDAVQKAAPSFMATGTDQRYVIVGAGPVGLWTALQLKLRMPQAQVTIYEKRSAYTRTQVLTLSREVFQIGSGGMEEFISNLEPKLISAVGKEEYQTHRNRPTVRIVCNALEKILKERALELGVAFVQFTVESRDQFFEHVFTSSAVPPNLVIGADSRHSVTRDALLADSPAEMLKKEHIKVTNLFQYNVFLKFHVKESLKLSRFQTFTWARALLNMKDHNCALIIGGARKTETKHGVWTMKERMFPVTVQIPLIKEEAEVVLKNCKQRARGTEPCTVLKRRTEELGTYGRKSKRDKEEELRTEENAINATVPRNGVVSDKRVPDKVRSDIAAAFEYLASSPEEAEELKFTTEISLVLVDTYRATNVGKTLNVKRHDIEMGSEVCSDPALTDDCTVTIPFVLVGDSAFGVPYFKGLVNGLYTAIELAALAADTLGPAGEKMLQLQHDIQEQLRDEDRASVDMKRIALQKLREVSSTAFVGAYKTIVEERFSDQEAIASKTSLHFVGQNSLGMALKRGGQMFTGLQRFLTPSFLKPTFDSILQTLPSAIHPTNASFTRMLADITPPVMRGGLDGLENELEPADAVEYISTLWDGDRTRPRTTTTTATRA